VGTKKIPTNNKNSVSNKVFTTDWTTLTKDFMTWYNYTYYNIRLSQDFIGLDIDSIEIDKATFLNKLLTGNVVAFKIKILQGEPVYKLYKLNSNDESIKATIKQMASTEMEHFKMEGIENPKFNFTDLNGKTYNNSSTKGKIIVLKCWFIHCVACVKEIPELNKLVEQNENRNDILFISLAIDAKQNLIKFLKTKEFNYAVIPEMENYMVDKLHITTYPTHLLIDKSGKIVKIVNRIDDLIPFLKRETAKTNFDLTTYNNALPKAWAGH
jgi:thiol-disulfide isomerase/thioredoxin